MGSIFSFSNNKLDLNIDSGIGYRMWIYQSSYSAQLSIFSQMNNGPRLKVELNGYKELTLNNESGSQDV